VLPVVAPCPAINLFLHLHVIAVKVHRCIKFLSDTTSFPARLYGFMPFIPCGYVISTTTRTGEVELRREQQPSGRESSRNAFRDIGGRATHDYRDIGGRVTPGAVTEAAKAERRAREYQDAYMDVDGRLCLEHIIGHILEDIGGIIKSTGTGPIDFSTFCSHKVKDRTGARCQQR
jgi:hypothetical protein